MATYNRSDVLRLAIETVRRQTLQDWELLVVGDGCTDDSEAVAGSFGDPRISFRNLPENSGNQARPNSVGMALARGAYIAFLNHDDLWLSDHLEAAVAALEAGSDDLVFTLMSIVMPEGERRVGGAIDGGRYQPFLGVPASSWVFRRELAARIGAWREPDEIFAAPSQDWLLRGHRLGFRARQVPKLTVVAIQSGSRPGSYLRPSAEHREFFERMQDEPRFREEELTLIAAQLGAISPDQGSNVDLLRYAARFARNLLRRLSLALGSSPGAFYALKFGRRGGYIRHLRKERGLG